jgi:16S rRNA (cytosine1402-N4)-methyltransferase
VPVLLPEVLDALGALRGGVFLDGTFGAGGYARGILAAHPSNRLIAIDRDPDAVAAGADLVQSSGGRLTLVEGRFGDLDRIARDAGGPLLDGVTLDVGVSSMQLDRAERGFSFRFDAPLDMRMEKGGPSAADLVNEQTKPSSRHPCSVTARSAARAASRAASWSAGGAAGSRPRRSSLKSSLAMSGPSPG